MHHLHRRHGRVQCGNQFGLPSLCAFVLVLVGCTCNTNIITISTFTGTVATFIVVCVSAVCANFLSCLIELIILRCHFIWSITLFTFFSSLVQLCSGRHTYFLFSPRREWLLTLYSTVSLFMGHLFTSLLVFQMLFL